MFRIVGRNLGGRLLAGAANAAHSTPVKSESNVDTLVPCADLSNLLPLQSDESSAPLPLRGNLLTLDYFTKQKATGANNADVSTKLADVTLLNRIITAVSRFESSGDPAQLQDMRRFPFVVVILSSLSPEDAEMQQLILRNALLMNPASKSLHFHQPVVWVMCQEESERVRRAGFEPKFPWKKLIAVSSTPPSKPPTSPAAAAAPAAGAAAGPQAASATTAPPKATTPPNKAASPAPTAPPAESVTKPAADTARAAGSAEASLPVSPPSPNPVFSSSLAYRSHEMEKELWRSSLHHPIDLQMLRPLLDPATYYKASAWLSASSPSPGTPPPVPLPSASSPPGRQRKAAAKSPTAAEPTRELHVLLYRLGVSSTLSSVWHNVKVHVGELYAQLTGDTSLEEQLRSATSAARAVGASHSREPRAAEQVKSASRPRRRGGATPAATTPEQGTADAVQPGILLLVHANTMVGGDVDLFRRELQISYADLPEAVRQIFLGVQVISAREAAEEHLIYLLQHATRGAPRGLFPEVFTGLTATTATTAAAAAAPQNAGAAVDTAAGREATGVLVAQSAQLVALFEALLEKREVKMRQQAEEAYRAQRQEQAGHEQLALAAQKVELKTMMTDAVEEVSVRHEQATAHLVKTLSTMVGQWSSAKLLDAFEALLRDRLLPLQESLANATALLEAERTAQNTCEQQIASLALKVEALSGSWGLAASTPAAESYDRDGASDTAAATGSLPDRLQQLLASAEGGGAPSATAERLGEVMALLNRLHERVDQLYQVLPTSAGGAASGSPAGAPGDPDSFVRHDQIQSALLDVIDAVGTRVDRAVSEQLPKYLQQLPAPSHERATSPPPVTTDAIGAAVRDALAAGQAELLQKVVAAVKPLVANAAEKPPSVPATSFNSVALADRVLERLMESAKKEQLELRVMKPEAHGESAAVTQLSPASRADGRENHLTRGIELQEAIKLAMTPMIEAMQSKLEHSVRQMMSAEGSSHQKS